MRSQPRVLLALSVSVAFLFGGYACSNGTFPNRLSVYDPDAGALPEDSSVPVDAADAQMHGDGGDAGSAADAGDGGHAGDGGDGGDAGSATEAAAPLDAGDGGLGDGDLEDASDLDDASATG